jgi:hypothetical protein
MNLVFIFLINFLVDFTESSQNVHEERHEKNKIIYEKLHNIENSMLKNTKKNATLCA